MNIFDYILLAVCFICMIALVFPTLKNIAEENKPALKPEEVYYRCKTSFSGFGTEHCLESEKQGGFSNRIETPTMAIGILSSGSKNTEIKFDIYITSGRLSSKNSFLHPILRISDEDYVKLASGKYILLEAKIINKDTGEEVK